ncbi:MAG: aminotransferase class IV [Planctomycetia bacterium]|nr:aminotransferase class IV [Planctomycetia bacterium]
MSNRVVYFNGRFVPEDEARVSIYDFGLLMGDMAFEVTRSVAGRPFRLDDHLRRLAHTLSVLRIDPGLANDAQSTSVEPAIAPSPRPSPARGEGDALAKQIAVLEQITLATLARNLPTEPAEVDWSIIHNISRGPAPAFGRAFAPADMRPTVIVSCYPLVDRLAALAPAYESGIDLVVPAQRALPGDLLDDALKARSRLHYQLANLQAAEIRAGAWAVLVDPAGHLTEGTTGNVFIVREGELRTPRAENLLPGVTRQLVIELAGTLGIPCRQVDLTPADAAAADEMFITATSIGILHARSFEGRAIGDGRLGPIAGRLREALGRLVGVDFAAQARRYAQMSGTG